MSKLNLLLAVCILSNSEVFSSNSNTYEQDVSQSAAPRSNVQTIVIFRKPISDDREIHTLDTSDPEQHSQINRLMMHAQFEAKLYQIIIPNIITQADNLWLQSTAGQFSYNEGSSEKCGWLTVIAPKTCIESPELTLGLYGSAQSQKIAQILAAL